MSKVYYSFNHDTFAYERLRLHPKRMLGNLGVAFVVALLLAGVYVANCLIAGRHIEDQWLAQHNEVLAEQVNAQTRSFEAIHARLNNLHQKDNNFYRSLLNQEKIEASVWQGGMGGSDKYRNLGIAMLQSPSILADRLAHQFRLQDQSFALLEQMAEQKSQELKHTPAIRPVPGVIVGGFGYRRDPFHGHAQYHPALDFDGDSGDKIFATGDGKVQTAGVTEWGYGIQVEIDHGFGYVTKYAHMSKVAVMPGQQVKRGDLIGYIGNTGYSVGPHLHYEVIKNGVKVNPYGYFYNN